MEQSIALLAAELGVDASDVEVRRSVEVTWRDGSIGCPKPGFMYTQALMPGVLVELAVDGVTYAFHQAHGRPPFYCPNPAESPPS